MDKKKYLTKEQKFELIKQQVSKNQFHWGSTDLILCKDCISIFDLHYNNDKIAKYCPFCGSQELVSYWKFNIKGLEDI